MVDMASNNNNNNKRDISDVTEDKPDTKNKRQKSSNFSVKEFRNSLHGNQRLKALQNFLQQIKDENKSHDYALEYLQKHGSVHEIIQIMEEDSSLSPELVFEIVNELLLKIISAKLNCYEATFESCSYLMNNFITAINKMIGLTSSSKERIVVLKLLTSMSTFSSKLSKDILLHVNFNLTNLELITKNTIENKTVRKHFVYFLTAILIDIEYPTLSLLLEKKGMLTSIVSGLQYDEADTVCFMITAMKNNILENQFVSKSVKMKTFNTIVIKNIVNLYNWKGPSNLTGAKKEAAVIPIQIDEVSKAKVNECVHDFLLILCTSHKFGVIFRDPSLGMGKKTQNALILTVIDSMESPWDHSYASELIIKICSACPDLTKYVWNNLKGCIEPRHSTKWINAIDFAKKLLEELQPSCLEAYVKNLNFHQISQIVTILIAPLPILKTLIPENFIYELQIIKFNVVSFVSTILKALQNYIKASETWLSKEQHAKLKIHLENYVGRNFPSGLDLLKDWKENEKGEDKTGYCPIKYLSVTVDIFKVYVSFCPELLESLKFSHRDLKELLESIDNFQNEENNGDIVFLKVNLINLFLNVNPAIFCLESSSFEFFLSFLLEVLHSHNIEKNKKVEITGVLGIFLKNTGVFEYAGKNELNVWINGVFGLKRYDKGIAKFLTEILKRALSKGSNYTAKFMGREKELWDIFFLSPMLLTVLEYLENGEEVDKVVLSYLNFLIPIFVFGQNKYTITYILEKEKSFERHLSEYVNTLLLFNEDADIPFQIPKVLRVFGKRDVFGNFLQKLTSQEFSEYLISDEETLDLYPDLKLNLLQMGIFYLSKLLKINNEENHSFTHVFVENLKKYVAFLLTKEYEFDPDVIFNQLPLMLYFALEVDENGKFHSGTQFFIDLTEMFSKEGKRITYVNFKLINQKIARYLDNILENPEKDCNKNIPIVTALKIFQMKKETYFSYLTKISSLISENVQKCIAGNFYSILVFILEKCLEFSNSVKIDGEIVKNVCGYFVTLNKTKMNEIKSSSLSEFFVKYFTEFPEEMRKIDSKFVKSIMCFKEFDKAHTELLVLLLSNRQNLIYNVNDHLDDLINVKGMFYPVLQVIADNYSNILILNEEKIGLEKILKRAFEKTEDTIHKAIKKPQKASQHLDKHFKGVELLLNLYFDKEKFVEYAAKVQKFEVTRAFHVNFLYIVFKKILETEITDNKIVCNTFLTLTHYLLNALKRIPKNEEEISEVIDVSATRFLEYLELLITRCEEKNGDFLKSVYESESFKLLVKFCLKYGVSKNVKLLEILTRSITLMRCHFGEEEMTCLMGMLTSHSEFLDVVLGEENENKSGILSLMLVVSEGWPGVMERNHVPILLSSYYASCSETDRKVLKLLKMYESVRNQTAFYDFKPYLWGPTGANHYSVRSDIEKALIKQPKTKDVLNILQENVVLSTIENYHRYNKTKSSKNNNAKSIYDLEFLLPLFGHILAHENAVQTYHFTRSGALSLTILGLSSESYEIRASACHVLARFHFHMEARQTGKDNLLWLRLVEVICKGLTTAPSVDDDGSIVVLNNFVTIFLAKTALILTQPNHVMYLPLTQYLAAKSTLNLSSIPELYTFLHGADVNHREHREFIFEILCDGLISEEDYVVFFKSMALKLITEFYSSCVCDPEAKRSILEVMLAVCREEVGMRFICAHNSMVEYLVMDLRDNLRIISSDNSYKSRLTVVCKLVAIFDRLWSNMDADFVWGRFLINDACEDLQESDVMDFLPEGISKIVSDICKKGYL